MIYRLTFTIKLCTIAIFLRSIFSCRNANEWYTCSSLCCDVVYTARKTCQIREGMILFPHYNNLGKLGIVSYQWFVMFANVEKLGKDFWEKH